MITQDDGDDYTLEILLDTCARELGCDTNRWVASGLSYETIHDDYAEFNHQLNYIMGAEFRRLFVKRWKERIKEVGHGLDSYATAIVTLQVIKEAKKIGMSLPDGREISRHVMERTEHEWKGCG